MGKQFSTELENTSLLRQMQLVEARPNPGNKGPYLYALYLLDASTGRVVKQFGFDIPPQVNRLGEDFAGDVAAGQEGGYWTDDRGQYFKMLQISGTFGFRPTRVRVGIDGPLGNLLNRVARASNQLVRSAQALAGTATGAPTIPSGETTGFDRLRKLLNLLRLYGDLKKHRSTAASAVLVWANWKTGEVYTAQPIKFERDRTAPGGRYKYNYNFTLRLLSPLQVTAPPDYLHNPLTPNGKRQWFQKMRQAMSVVRNAIGLVGETIDAGVDFAEDVIRTVIAPLREVMNTVERLMDTGLRVASFPLETLRSVHQAAYQTAISLMQKGQAYRDLGQEYSRLARGIRQMWQSLSVYGSSDVNSDLDEYGSKYGRRHVPDVEYPDEVMVDAPPPYNTTFEPGTWMAPTGKRAMRVPSNATIRQFADRVLGDPGRWLEIALLNRLQAPYFDANGDGVLVKKPGDLIDVPADVSAEEGQVIDLKQNTDITEFGTDFRVNLESRRFVIKNGDIDIVSGTDNLRQAMYIKIWTEPGDLVLHPWFGFDPDIGEGLVLDMVSRYYLQLRTTILSDTRIAKILYMSFRSQGDVLFADVILEPKNQDGAKALRSLKIGSVP